MALWNPLRFERKQIINSLGDGINTGVPPFDIKDSELTYIRNMGSQEYPAITTRYGRTFLSTSMPTIAIPNGIGERNNEQLHVIDGNTWKYWNAASTAFVNLTTSLTSTDGDIQDFATGTDRYTILMNSTQKLYWDGTSTAATLGDANTPFTKIFTVHKGRIYAARDNDIMYCALNLINDWTSANDAGSIDITRSKGAITGLTEYNDKVIAFTEFGMHELYGDDPANFTLVDIEGNVGCISNKSIVKCNRRLMWLGIDGIYQYEGASPIKISQPVDDYIKAIDYTNRTKAVSGSIGDFFYIAIPYNATSNNLILVYDTRIRKWYVETGNYIDFVTIQNTLYGLDSTGGIMDMRNESATDDNGTPITWELITKAFTDGTVSQKKTLTDISLIYNASTNATLNTSYSTSATSTSFTALAVSTDFSLSAVEENKRLIIPTTDLQNIDWYRLKINGTGKVTMHYLEKDFRIKRR